MADVSEAIDDPLLRKLKRWFRLDKEFSANWRKEAQDDFAFVAGEQWSEEDKAKLKEQMRPLITFNRILPIINAVAGQEIGNRQEVRYIPREMGDVKPNELLTSAAEWFRDLADADDEDSDAFMNAAICGMGWTETTLSFEDNERGDPGINSINPLEMFWDRNARKKNLGDAERVARARRLSRSRAKEIFPDAEDSDLDAKWAQTDLKDGETENQDEEDRYEGDGSEPKADDDGLVTIVHMQWREKVNEIRFVDWAGREQTLDEKEYKKIKKRLDERGIPYAATRRSRKVIKQAWIGGKVLRTNEALCPYHFHYQCVTAHMDKNSGTFFGLVRQMKDPQRWANKWLSQSLDIMNSLAKGGIMIEKGTTDDIRELERTWARSDKITTFPRGALQNGAVQPKPVGQFPAGFYNLMEFAISSIRDVTGVSVEMLGMREADQPASLEYQRRQAGMTILAPLFSNLKRYRHDQGRVMLYLIQNYLSDERLIRIVGEEQEQYVPLVKQADVEYDIIVDDHASSPNQKEMVWSMIGNNFWNLPPEMQIALLEYSPFPTSVVQKVKEAQEQAQQGPMAQLQQKMAQLEAMLQEAEVGKTVAETAETKADTQKTLSEIGQGGSQSGESDLMREMMRIRANTASEGAKMAQNASLEKRQQDMNFALGQRELAQKGTLSMADLALKAQQRNQQDDRAA